MPTTLAPRPEAAALRPSRYVLETNAEPDVLLRVLTLLRRRGCRIVAVDFHEPDQHGPGRLEVSVRAPTRIGHRLEAWLTGLVDVVAVRPVASPDHR
jgi:acetolactate synthase regulatory subunit